MNYAETVLDNMANSLSHQQISELLLSVFQHAPNVFFVKDSKGRYVIVNQAFEHYVNLPLQDIIGKTDFDIMNHEDAVACVESDQPALNAPNITNTSFENEHNDAGDITAYLAVNKKVISTELGNLLIGIATRVAT